MESSALVAARVPAAPAAGPTRTVPAVPARPTPGERSPAAQGGHDFGRVRVYPGAGADGEDAGPAGRISRVAPAQLLQRQDAGTRRPDAGGAPRDAGATGAPSGPPAGARAGLTARFVAANTGGFVNPANCVLPSTMPLGPYDRVVRTRSGRPVYTGRPWTNHIELVWSIAGTIGPGVAFDIKRTRGSAVCEVPAPGAAWRQVGSEPTGTPDDRDNADECLVPQPPDQRIFANDGPGFAGRDVRGATLLTGHSLSPTVVAVRLAQTFEEWVEATAPGGPSAPISPRVAWHSTVTLDDPTPAPAAASWRRTPGAPNEIGLGSIPRACLPSGQPRAGAGTAGPSRR